MSHEPRLTIVIPAYNEEAAISSVLEDVKTYFGGHSVEVVVIDDRSLDSTARLAQEAGVRVIRHHRNMGYGASLKTGIKLATGDYILTMDSDGQHTAEEALHLWKVMQAQEGLDMVIGQRASRQGSPSWRLLGKWIIERLANYLARIKIPDLNSGLRLMKRDVAMAYLHLCPSGFSFSTTMTLAFLCRNRNVLFVPVGSRMRVGNSTVSVMTGFDVILLVLRLATLFNPLRLFLPLSFAFVMCGSFWSIPYLLGRHGLSVASMLMIVTGVILFFIGLLCDQISQLRMERFE